MTNNSGLIESEESYPKTQVRTSMANLGHPLSTKNLVEQRKSPLRVGEAG
jgi:hypothetical protein